MILDQNGQPIVANDREFRSLENPNTPLSDPDEWLRDLAGTQTASGLKIDRGTALTYAAVWRAISLISRDVAKIPLCVYRRLDTGGKERATDHQAYALLKRNPYPKQHMTAFTFKQTLTGHVLLHGNGYGYIFRAGNMRPTGIAVLNPEVTYPVIANGVLWYVTRIDGEDIRLRARDVLHIKGLGFDGIMGYSVLSFARESMGLGIAAQRYGSTFFGNDAKPSVILEHPGVLKPEAAAHLKESWNAMHQGIGSAHKTAVLEEGMKLKPLSINAEDAQLIQTREFEIREIANWFGVPPHKLGDPTRTAFASLEQEQQSYLDESLDGWLVNWEQECTEKLLTEAQKNNETHFVEFNRDVLVRIDFKTRTEAEAKEVNQGLATLDEVRARRNMPPIDDGFGSKLRIPLNIGFVGEQDPAQEPVEPEPEPEEGDEGKQNSAIPEQIKANRNFLDDALHRMSKRISHSVKRKAKKPEEFMDWIEGGMRTEFTEFTRSALAPAFDVMKANGVNCGEVDSMEDSFFSLLESRLLTACDSKPSGLKNAVDRAIAAFEEVDLKEHVYLWIGEKNNGT